MFLEAMRQKIYISGGSEDGQEKDAFQVGGGESVQTIVVPVGNTGSDEPLQQTIRIESPERTATTGSLKGITLNVNVNIVSENAADQKEILSPSTVQQSGASWYQIAVLCLLSGILVCVIRRR